ncbi:MAG: translocation/assembly module TamB domain-containing protein, partial [Gemmatimonadota bacterium]
MSWSRRLLRGSRLLAQASFRTLAVATVLVAAALFALLKTGLGHQVILDWSLDQLRNQVAGSVQVQSLRSGNILRSGRLVGVEFLTPEGDPVIRADSIGLRYDLRGVIGGRIALTDIQVWGLEMDMTWTPEVQGSTLSRWIGASDEPGNGDEGGGEGDGLVITLSDIRVQDGMFRLRRPTGLAQDGLVRVLEQDGGTLALDAVIREARIPRVAVAPEDAGGTRVEVDGMRGDISILREGLSVEDFEGEVLIVGSRVVANLENLQLPQARFAGAVTVHTGPDPDAIVEVDVEAREIQGRAFTWIVDWLPPFVGDARVTGVVRDGFSDFRFRDLDARWSGTPLTGSGRLLFGDGVAVRDMRLTVDGLPLSAVAPYVSALESRDGTLTGNVRLDGPVESLGVEGLLTLSTPLPEGEGRAAATAEVSAVFFPGVGDLRIGDGRARVDPLDYRTLLQWVPALPFRGAGQGVIEASGSLREGLRFRADLTHLGVGGVPSRVLARGGLRQTDDSWSLDVQGDAAPLQLATLRRRWRRLPLQGSPSVSFRLNGALEELALRLELAEGQDGRLEAEGRFDARNLAGPIRVQGRMEDFDLGRYLLPARERTRLTGTFEGQAAGWGSDLTGDAVLRVTDSRLRGVPVDSVRIRATVADGFLELDTLRARAGGFEFDGGGRMALARTDVPASSGSPAEALSITFGSDSLMGLRPAFLGDEVPARDTLNDLDREILLLSGVDPDTLPLVADVTLRGRVEGRVEVEGSLDRFSGRGELRVDGLGYGENWLESARLDVRGRDLPGRSSVLEMELSTDSIHALDRDLAETRVAGSLTSEGARVTMDIQRGPGERYRAAGGLRRDAASWRANVDQVELSFDSMTYLLTAPTEVVWSDSVLAVREMELVRRGPDPVRIRADGRLPRQGAADFTLDVQGLHLERLVQVLQLEGVELAGHVDLEVDVEGTAAAPLIGARLEGRDLVVGSFTAGESRVVLGYEDQQARLDFRLARDGTVLLEGAGVLPVDVPLWGGRIRALDRPMELDARLDQVPVAPILAVVEDLEEVEGVLTGDFEVRGTPEAPEPRGLVRLSGGGWTVGALGVRQDSVRGTFSLTPDGSVAVNASGRAGGRVDVSGEVRLTPLRNPGLDLNLRFQQFQAVDRRDLAGTISGEVEVTGEYVRPRVAGNLTVDQGTIYLEEFQRAVGVVDLSDPLFLGLVEGESFAVPVDRPLLAGARNPFLDSLRVDVSLDVPRETWLRSDDMNVEIGGSLDMVYDRPRRDFVLIGELLAQRGQYVVLGRTFEVEGGSVEFIGIPGLNPLLDIEATSQVRRRNGEPLIITATVSGTLVDPSVELTSTEQSLAQSDLVSYLIFGQPSSEYNSTAGLTGAGRFLERGVQAGVTFGVGTLASQLGALAAQQTSIFDYLAVTQVG